MNALLEPRSVEVGYGEFRVLHEVDLEVRQGEMVAIVGPNGAGKTTLLKTIMGLTTIYGGSIVYSREDIKRLKPGKRVKKGLVLTPEGRGLFPYLTVKENLLLRAYIVRYRRRHA